MRKQFKSTGEWTQFETVGGDYSVMMLEGDHLKNGDDSS